MGERTSYEPGTFSYAELATSDAAGAKEFYSGLFGWEPEDAPVGDEMVYTMLRLGGKIAASAYESTRRRTPRGSHTSPSRTPTRPRRRRRTSAPT